MSKFREYTELQNISLSYYPNFKSYCNTDYEDYENKITMEYLQIINEDLRKILLFISDLEKSLLKEELMSYISLCRFSLFLEITKYVPKSDLPEDLLNLNISNNYVMVSFYTKESLESKKNPKPTILVMSRNLKPLEFYFIERIEEDLPKYIDADSITYYKINNKKVSKLNFYVNNYSFIRNGIITNLEELTLELKKKMN